LQTAGLRNLQLMIITSIQFMYVKRSSADYDLIKTISADNIPTMLSTNQW